MLFAYYIIIAAQYSYYNICSRYSNSFFFKFLFSQEYLNTQTSHEKSDDVKTPRMKAAKSTMRKTSRLGQAKSEFRRSQGKKKSSDSNKTQQI